MERLNEGREHLNPEIENLRIELKSEIQATLGDLQARREIIVNNAKNNVGERIANVNRAVLALINYDGLMDEGLLYPEDVLNHIIGIRSQLINR